MLPAYLGTLWLCAPFIMSSQASSKDFVAILTGDDNLTVYADGRLVGHNGGVWNAPRWFTFSNKTRTIAVSVYNGPPFFGGFLGVFSNGVVTDGSWKCKETDNPENGWEKTNFNDTEWQYANIRQDNSGLKESPRVDGIPPNVYWISAANHYATRFICRRQFSTEERKSNSILIAIRGLKPTHRISLYLDGVFIAKAVRSLTLIKHQCELQAVQVEDGPSIDVSFLASSSSGFRTDKWWRCTNVYHEGWFLPCYNDTSWPRSYVSSNIEKYFIAPEAKWIGYVGKSNKIYCRRYITIEPFPRITQDTPCANLQTSVSSTVPTITMTQNVTSPSRASGTSDSSNTDMNRLSTLVIAVIAISGGVAAVIIGSAISCYVWRKRKNGREKNNNELQDRMKDKWEIRSDDIIIGEELGHGAFGEVFKGIMKNPLCMTHGSIVHKTTKKAAKSTITVAIKMLHENANPDQMNDFLDEINLMKAAGSHKNIVSLIGCCIKSSPNFLVVEFASKGDLLSYLREQRKKVKDGNMVYVQGRENPGNQKNAGIHCESGISDIGEVIVGFTKTGSSINMRINSAQSLNDDEQEQEDSLTLQDMMSFSWQIAQGMDYLSGQGIVHRDLAARNVLVCEKKLVKVADFGLARRTLGEKAYRMAGQRIKLPFKWMSPEAISDGVFTTKSDVWSYGVLLWEIATLGGSPYPGIRNRELIRLLKRGYRMEKPDICSEELYQMMTRCWADNPDARPTFTELCQDLEDWMQRDTPYLHMDQLDEDQPYYNASAISASSGSLCKEPASESHDSNTTAENLACDDNTVF